MIDKVRPHITQNESLLTRDDQEKFSERKYRHGEEDRQDQHPADR